MKKCLLILPYFGKFNNYFPLYLKSIETNTGINWLIITDDRTPYSYPDNVKVIYCDFPELAERAKAALGKDIYLEYPYKLCDFKPAYGVIFEEEVKDYEYWGYCDCDVVYGSLNRLLIPVLEQGYEKIFTPGHMTIYRNSEENNHRFLHACGGKYFYKNAFTSKNICWFDEPFRDESIHEIFMNEGAKVYCEDMCASPYIFYSQFCMTKYTGRKDEQRYVIEKADVRSGFYWDHGSLYRIVREKDGSYTTKEYLYIHLQRRKMTCDPTVTKHDLFQIYPNGFEVLDKVPETDAEKKYFTRYRFCTQWFDIKSADWKKKIRDKLRK